MLFVRADLAIIIVTVFVLCGCGLHYVGAQNRTDGTNTQHAVHRMIFTHNHTRCSFHSTDTHTHECALRHARTHAQHIDTSTGWINTHVLSGENSDSYPIQYCRPTFHGDTLKYRQHSKPDIVEAGDAVVRADPLFAARARIVVAIIRAARRHRLVVRVARRHQIALAHNFLCGRIMRPLANHARQTATVSQSDSAQLTKIL